MNFWPSLAAEPRARPPLDHPHTLADNLRFLRAVIARPKNIGALFPSSPALAEAIARQIDPGAGPVLEIGSGTGVVTEAILARGVAPENLTLLEYDEDLARHLRRPLSQGACHPGRRL